jgi:3'-phosphoadenosine 5'-phosphosulfate sulfotransferase (PAPS reductase)/FAD synthetase
MGYCVKYSLKFYKRHVREIARQCGMGNFELICIDHIRSWDEMLALIDFIKEAYKVPAYKIGPAAIKTPQELAQYIEARYDPAEESIFGDYNEWETL